MQRFRTILIACGLGLCAALGAATAPAPQDTQQQDTNRRADASIETIVVPLQHADASDAEVVVMSIGHTPGLRLVPDERTNALIVSGSPESLERVRELIAMIDVPAEADVGDRRVVMYELANRQVDDELENVIQRVMNDRHTRLAVDRERDIVIADTTVEGHERISTLLDRLDTPGEKTRTSEQTTLRLVWLVSGLDDAGSDIPPDLADVEKELSGIGINNLRMAAQTLVRVSAYERFAIQCTAALDQPTALEIHGDVNDVSENGAEIQVSIEGSESMEITVGRRSARQSRTLAALNTTITAPFDHSVVLGVSPMETMQSVFVVQVLSD